MTVNIEITGTEEINGINTFKYLDRLLCVRDGSGGGEELHLVNDDTNGFGFFSQSEDGSYSLVKLIEPYVKKGTKLQLLLKILVTVSKQLWFSNLKVLPTL